MAQQVSSGHDIRYHHEIEGMLRQDSQSPPPLGAIVFTGSSIFRLWATLKSDMHPLPAVNRAFGGARTWEVVHYMDSVIMPLKPSIIVYYCGGNDIESGESPGAVLERFGEFCSRVHASLPKTKIYFVSLNKAPQKAGKWAELDEINRMAAERCSRDGRLGYIDINPPFFNGSGQLRRELYIGDGLHFMPDAYRILTSRIKPVIESAWEEVH